MEPAIGLAIAGLVYPLISDASPSRAPKYEGAVRETLAKAIVDVGGRDDPPPKKSIHRAQEIGSALFRKIVPQTVSDEAAANFNAFPSLHPSSVVADSMIGWRVDFRDLLSKLVAEEFPVEERRIFWNTVALDFRGGVQQPLALTDTNETWIESWATAVTFRFSYLLFKDPRTTALFLTLESVDNAMVTKEILAVTLRTADSIQAAFRQLYAGLAAVAVAVSADWAGVVDIPGI